MIWYLATTTASKLNLLNLNLYFDSQLSTHHSILHKSQAARNRIESQLASSQISWLVRSYGIIVGELCNLLRAANISRICNINETTLSHFFRLLDCQTSLQAIFQNLASPSSCTFQLVQSKSRELVRQLAPDLACS